jgi:NADPH2 dehydrogenase
MVDSRVAKPSIVPNVWSAGSKPFVKSTGSTELPPKFTTMAKVDIDRFVGHYRQAALNAVEASFDGVELHGANGYVSFGMVRSSIQLTDITHSLSINS